MVTTEVTAIRARGRIAECGITYRKGESRTKPKHDTSAGRHWRVCY